MSDLKVRYSWCVNRYDRSKDPLSKLEIPIWIGGFGGKAGQGMHGSITVMRYTCDARTGKRGHIESVSKGF
jgi:hypothetical protein